MKNTNGKCRLSAQTIILTTSFARLWNQASLQAALNIRRYPVACKGRVVVLPSSGLNELTLFDCYCSGLLAEGSAQVLASSLERVETCSFK